MWDFSHIVHFRAQTALTNQVVRKIGCCSGIFKVVKTRGAWVAQWLSILPVAQVVILGSWNRVPHQAHHKEPASPSAYVSIPLCVSLMNKQIKSFKKRERCLRLKLKQTGGQAEIGTISRPDSRAK